jgi:hypothetical protein
MADRLDERLDNGGHGAFRHSVRVGLLVLLAVVACLNVAWTTRALDEPTATNTVGSPDPTAAVFVGAIVSGHHLRDRDSSAETADTAKPSLSSVASSPPVDTPDDGHIGHDETVQAEQDEKPEAKAPAMLVHYTAKQPALEMEAAWADLNGPQIDIRYYSDDDARTLVAQHRAHFLETYDTQLSPVERADYFRYLVLWLFGGLYIDSDIQFVRPVDQWLGAFGWDTARHEHGWQPLASVPLTVGIEFPFPQTGYTATGWLPLQFTQFVIAGAKGSSLIATILGHVEECVRRVDRQGDVERTLERTGPAAFTRAILNVIQTRGIVDESVVRSHADQGSPADPRYPRALLPYAELEKKGQWISLGNNSASERDRDIASALLVLPYRAFGFHSSHGIAKAAVLTRHLFHNSWRHDTA